MTTADFQITDTDTGQQLAVSDVHAALAEPAAAHTDHTPPLPITDSMDRWAYERFGMSIDAYLRETWAEFDAVSRSLDEKGLPPMTPAPPEPQWAELDEPETPARPVGGHVYDDATGWVPQVPDGAATRAALTVQARRAGITTDDPEPAQPTPPARSRLRDVLRRAWRRIDDDTFGPAEQQKETP